MLERDEAARAEPAVAGVGHVRGEDPQRHLALLGVAVAAHGDERARLGIEDALDGEARLERLAHPLHGRQEEALGPAADAFPGEGVLLLPGDRRGERGPQVQVEDVQGGPGG